MLFRSHLPSGELDLSQIFSVCSVIGEFLKSSPKQFTIAIRSTIKPGTCEKIALLVEKISGLKAHEDFFIVSNPEFLREGTAIDDYLSPSYVVIGGPQNIGSNNIASLYSSLDVEIKFVDYGTAETIKYINNSWHAVKVAFGNEIGAICTAFELNTNEIFDLFFADTILNISTYYLKPGFPYGGACLPKDLSAMVSLSKEKGMSAPLIESTSLSNEAHISRSVSLVKAKATEMNINYIGLSFKYDTDDIRNSPSIIILKSLIAEGYKIKIYDKNVSDSLRLKKNNKLLTSILGNLEEFIVTELNELDNFSDMYVLAKSEPEVITYIQHLKNKTVVDLIGWNGSINPSNKVFKLINS